MNLGTYESPCKTTLMLTALHFNIFFKVYEYLVDA